MADETTPFIDPTVVVTKRAKPTLEPEPVFVPIADAGVATVYTVIASVSTVFDTLDEAMSYYNRNFSGSGDDLHSVSVVDGTGAVIAGPSQWSYFVDEKGPRLVTTLSRVS